MKKIALAYSLLPLLVLASCTAGSTPASQAPVTPVTPVSSAAPVKKISDFIKANANYKTANNDSPTVTSGYFVNTDRVEYTTGSGAKVSAYYSLAYFPKNNELMVSGNSTINSQNEFMGTLYFTEGQYASSETWGDLLCTISKNSYDYKGSNFSFRADDCVSHFSYRNDTTVFSSPAAADSTQKIWLENAMYACNQGIQYFDALLVSFGYKTLGGSSNYSAQDLVWETL